MSVYGTSKRGSSEAKIGRFQACCICLFFTFFIVIGMLPIVQQTKRVVRNYHLVQSGMKATGRVVDYKESHGKRGRIWPVVSYVTAAGQTVSFESAYHPTYSGYSMGCEVPVLYDPAHPEVAEINEHERLWGGGVALYLVGALFIAFGSGGIVWILILRSRQNRSPSPPAGPAPYQM